MALHKWIKSLGALQCPQNIQWKRMLRGGRQDRHLHGRLSKRWPIHALESALGTWLTETRQHHQHWVGSFRAVRFRLLQACAVWSLEVAHKARRACSPWAVRTAPIGPLLCHLILPAKIGWMAGAGVAKQIELLRVRTAYFRWHHWATEATHHQTEQRKIAILCYQVWVTWRQLAQGQ